MTILQKTIKINLDIIIKSPINSLVITLLILKLCLEISVIKNISNLNLYFWPRSCFRLTLLGILEIYSINIDNEKFYNLRIEI